MDKIKFKCFEIEQPIGKFYVGVMNIKDALKISFKDERTRDELSVEEYIGIQRKLSKKRLSEIATYIKTTEATFPTSIILHVPEEHIEKNDDEEDCLYLDREGDYARVLDGQHRLFGFELARLDKGFDVPVTIVIDADLETQAHIFVNINLAQTKVSKSLAYDLYDYSKNNSPYKFCHNVVKILNNHEKSPFYKKIKMLGFSEGNKETLTQARFVDELMEMISSNPVEDTEILRNRNSERKSIKNMLENRESKQLAFRYYFIEDNYKEVARILYYYFKQIKKKWPNAWDNNLGKNEETNRVIQSILPKTTGFSGFMKFLTYIINNIVDIKIDEPETIRKKLDSIINKINIKEEDFVKEIYAAGKTGEVALYKDLIGYL